LSIEAHLNVDELGILTGQTGSTAFVSRNLLGDTRNADLFGSQAIIQFSGNGTPVSPQLLEAMSRDGGSDATAFSQNFAYGALSLSNNTYLKLVNVSDNAVGAEPEAVYTNSLIVPAGTTLDLNGLHLYTRAAQIGGTVIGGTITQIPDSGPITLANSTPGAISIAGELDEWTFFARAGQSIAVAVDTGGSGVLTPKLNWAHVELVDSVGNVIADNDSTAAGQIVTLDNVSIPTDGTFRVRVQAPVGHLSVIGNYLVGVWDATPNIPSLTVNQTSVGKLNSPFALDQWMFSATAGQQIQLHINAVSSPNLVFRLVGPGSPPVSVFKDLNTDSQLINLPATGDYILSAYALNGAIGSYSFVLKQTTVTNLELTTTYTGTVIGGGQAQLFRFSSLDPKALQLTLTDFTANHVNELYLKLGTAPTRSDYDFRATDLGKGSQQIIVPEATPGTWYVLVYTNAAQQPGAFSLLAEVADVFLIDVVPIIGGTISDTVLLLSGAGFNAQSVVQLVLGDGTSFPASDVRVDSASQMTVTFMTGSVPAGIYSIRVTSASGTVAELPDVFQMIDGGEGHLTAQVVVPSAVGYHAPATIYVKYANTGTVAIPAPLFALTAVQNGLQGAFLTLDQSRAGESYWTGAVPAGYSTAVSFMGSGANAGLLQPGESVTIPVHYAGWVTSQWDFSRPPIYFNLTSYTADDSRLIDWGIFGEQVRPIGVNEATWAPVLDRLKGQIGTTWGDYVAALAADAERLARRGERTVDASKLLDFELEQANGNPIGVISGRVVDAATGRPVAGVTVHDLSTDFRSAAHATTNATGAFTLARLYDGIHNLSLSGYLIDSNVPVTITLNTDVIGLELLANEAGRITGHVTAVSDGHSLSGVVVLGIGQTTGQVVQTLTAADGYYDLMTLLPDTYTLIYSKDSFASNTLDGITVSFGQSRSDINISLAAGAAITGTVRHDADSGILSGARVFLEGQVTDGAGRLMNMTTTDAAGEYAFTDLPTGTYMVRASARGYTDVFSILTIVEAGNGISHFDLELQQGAIITGSIATPDDNAPLSDAVVTVENDAGSIFRVAANENGRFALETLSAGHYTISIDFPGYMQWLGDTIVTAGEEVAILALLAPGAVVSGFLTAPDGHTPVVSALIEVYGPSGERLSSAISDNSGGYVLPALLPGSYTVAVTNSSYTFDAVVLNVIDTSPVTLSIVAIGSEGAGFVEGISQSTLGPEDTTSESLAVFHAAVDAELMASNESDLVQQVLAWHGEFPPPLPISKVDPLPPEPPDYAPAYLRSLWLELDAARAKLVYDGSPLWTEQHRLRAFLIKIDDVQAILDNAVLNFGQQVLTEAAKILLAQLGESTAASKGVQISFSDYVNSQKPIEVVGTAIYDFIMSVPGVLIKLSKLESPFHLVDLFTWAAGTYIDFNLLVKQLNNQKQMIINIAQYLEREEKKYEADLSQHCKEISEQLWAYYVAKNQYELAYKNWLKESVPHGPDYQSGIIVAGGSTIEPVGRLLSLWKPDPAHLILIFDDEGKSKYGASVKKIDETLLYDSSGSEQLVKLRNGSIAYDEVSYKVEDTRTHFQATGIWIIPVKGTNEAGDWPEDDNGPPQDPTNTADPAIPPIPPGGPGDRDDAKVVLSVDPNDKIGRSGFSQSGYVASTTALPYRINFENDPSATAPAQQVTITDQLSSNLDWGTFQLMDIGYGNTFISVPENSQYYSVTVPMTYNGQPLVVHIEAGFDPRTGRVFTTFNSIDPKTGFSPDVLTGFLPPEDGTGRGMGHISYLVDPKQGLASGTEIRNIAYIVFDGQPAIGTNQVDPHDPSQGIDPAKEALNTIDAGDPTSAVQPLPVETTQSEFLVSWAGEDDAGGSGIGTYDIFVSDNGGAFTAFLTGTTDTSALFTGQDGHSYAFYSVATDNVGHREAAPTGPDTITTVQLESTVNHEPVAEDDGPYAATEDELFTVLAAQGVLANDSDLNGDPLIATLLTQAMHGIVVLASDGGFTYLPTADFNGGDSFTYTVSDGQGGTATGTVSLTVTAVNDAPTFTIGGDQTVPENAGPQTVGGWAKNISPGPANESGQIVTFSVANDNPALFVLSPGVASDGTLTYTTAPNATGSALITVVLKDDGGTANGGVDTSSSQTFTITVNAVNHAPVLDPIGNKTINEGAMLIFTATATDEDVPAQALTFSLAPSAPDGASIDPTTGLFTWTPDEGPGDSPYSVTVQVSDGEVTTSETVGIAVLNVVPSVTLVPPLVVQEGVSATYQIEFKDPGSLDTHTIQISWGDGSTVESLISTADASGGITITRDHTYADNGVYAINVMVTDDEGAVGQASASVTVQNVAPVVTVTPNPSQTVQYSDAITPIVIAATDVASDTLNITTAWSTDGTTFTAGLPDELTITGGLALTGAANQVANGSWTINGIADLDPAKTYTIRVAVRDEDGGLTTQESVIDVTQEKARVTYTGVLYASTPSISNPTATIQLRATIQDITAAMPEWDADAGLISKATVTFVNRDDNNKVIASDVPVTLIDPADPKTGTAVYDWTVTLPNNSSSEQYTIGVIVHGFYARNASTDNAIVTVSLPQNDSLAGGGYLINASTAGTYAGDAGEKTNFGFNVKFNKKLTNLQGSANIIMRQGDHVYQVRTNATDSLSVNPVSTGIYDATFTSKANLVDITDPLNPISMGGNLDLIVTLRDAGEPGASDQIGINLWRSTELLFSSNWNGTQTVKQLLNGGNLQVRKSSALLAEGGALPEDGSLASLTDAELSPIVGAAKARWIASGVTEEYLAALAAVHVTIADLEGATLGQADGTKIWLDGTAAGHGWFIDSTPQDNAEFRFVNGLSQWMADGQSDAINRIDLLTVVMHEMGHVLGFGDQQAVHPTSATLMTETLGDGIRRTLLTEQVHASSPAAPRAYEMPAGERLSGLSLGGFSLKHFMGVFSPGSNGMGTRPSDLRATHSMIDWSEDESVAQTAAVSSGGIKMKLSWLSKFLSASGAKQERSSAHDFEVALPKRK